MRQQRRRVVSWVSVTLLAGWVGLVGACGASPPIQSTKAPELKQQITELVVVSNTGSRGFEANMADTLSACNVRRAIETVSPLELNPEEREERIKTFGAQHVLTVSLTGSTIYSNNTSRYTYDAVLRDVLTDRRMWWASIDFPFGSGSGEDTSGSALSRMLLNQLVKDGVLGASCHREAPVHETPPRQRSPSR